jgi:hypothetical protein
MMICGCGKGKICDQGLDVSEEEGRNRFVGAKIAGGKWWWLS